MTERDAWPRDRYCPQCLRGWDKGTEASVLASILGMCPWCYFDDPAGWEQVNRSGQVDST